MDFPIDKEDGSGERGVAMILTPAGRGSRANDFTREVIRNKLLAVAGETGIVLARTSMSPIVYEVLDFACGITDPQARVIAQDNGLCLSALLRRRLRRPAGA
jgi:hypothetical protein